MCGDLVEAVKQNAEARAGDREYHEEKKEVLQEKHERWYKTIISAHDEATRVSKDYQEEFINLRDHCHEILVYLLYKVELCKRDRKFIMKKFASIFGLKTPPPPPDEPELESLKVFNIAQNEKWKFFLTPGNLLDLDRSIKVSLRIRQFNDAEKATEDRHQRSYTLDSTKTVISFGKGKRARHFLYDKIFTEEDTQEEIGKINFLQNDQGWGLSLSAIFGYG